MGNQKFSDTDLFWNQLSEKDQPKQGNGASTESAAKQSSFAVGAQEKDGGITIDRNDLLKAVEQLSQMDKKTAVSSEEKKETPSAAAVISSGKQKEIGKKEISVAEEKKQESGKPWQPKGAKNIFGGKTSSQPFAAETTKPVLNDAAIPKKETDKNALPLKEERSVTKRGKNNGDKKKELTVDSVSEKKSTAGINKGMIAAIVFAAIVGVGSFLGVSHKLNTDKAEMMSYLEQQLTEIRTTNDAAIAQMHDTLSKMENNFGEITGLLEETGASIGTSSKESREAINQRIEKLDKQLQSLQKSLAIIQEDSNGRK